MPLHPPKIVNSLLFRAALVFIVARREAVNTTQFLYRTRLTSLQRWIKVLTTFNAATMAYSSSLTAQEWEILEPLLSEFLPQKKRTRPTNWTKREIWDGIFYQLKNGCNWQDLPKDLPPYSTVYWHYKQWRAAGVFETLMQTLHEQVRAQVKKNRSGLG